MIRRHRNRELAGHLKRIEDRIERLAQLVERDAAPASEPAGSDEILERLERVEAMLQLIYDREPRQRERLRRLREAADYERPFTAAEPLVSVVIATYDRGDLLVERAIPSVLGGSYENVELVVVGDDAPPETGTRLAGLADPRICYQNLPYRGPYPEDGRQRWHVAGVPPRNAAVALAGGDWIAPLDDDDAFHAHHIERLLELAQRGRHEVAYGRLNCLMNNGSRFLLGEFPPRFGEFGWQGAIFHHGLRFFEMELADALFGSPADWSLCRRMLRAGVRFGMLDEVVTDHYESRLGAHT